MAKQLGDFFTHSGVFHVVAGRVLGFFDKDTENNEGRKVKKRYMQMLVYSQVSGGDSRMEIKDIGIGDDPNRWEVVQTACKRYTGKNCLVPCTIFTPNFNSLVYFTLMNVNNDAISPQKVADAIVEVDIKDVPEFSVEIREFGQTSDDVAETEESEESSDAKSTRLSSGIF